MFKRIKNLWKLMWGKSNLWKNVGFHAFALMMFLFILLNRAGWEEWQFLYYAPTKLYYYPLYLPIFVTLFYWVGSYFSFKKSGQI